MKKFFTFIIVFMTLALPLKAHASDDKSTPTPIILSSHPLDDIPNETIPRVPMRIYVEAWYEAASKTITIIYDGYSSGEVFLYRDGELVDNATEINTTLQTCGSGVYTIEIIADSWTATGSLDI